MLTYTGKSRYLLLLGFLGIFCYVYCDVLTGGSVFQHEGTMWYGSFHYYVESLLQGHFPYWNPDLQAGTYFYPNIPFLGLLDPTVLVVVALRYLFDFSTLTGYVYFYIFRLLIFGAGAYLLYRHVTKSRTGAMLAAGILVLSLAPQYLRQPGALYAGFLTPLALYCLLRFMEEPRGEKGRIYVIGAALLYGISMNVYIPAYELFNLAAFLAGVWATGVVDMKAFVRGFKDRRVLAASAAAVVIVLMMMGPGLMVYFKDASGSGELFPVQRIALKSGGELKKVMASDIGRESLSDTLSNKQGYFIGYGNLANILFPDVFRSLPYFASKDYLAEMGGYIGIIPFLFALLGFIYGKSRYRYLALFMLIVIGINMFGWSGVSHKSFNLLQRLFNGIFPPLKLIDMRETFSPFFQLYLCMLLSMGLGVFFDTEKIDSAVRKRQRGMIFLCAAVVAVKVAVTALFGERWIYASLHDLFLLIAVIVFAVCVYAFSRGKLAGKIMYGVTVAVIMGELYSFNVYASESVLMDSRIYSSMVEAGRESGRTGFQFFRELFPSQPNVAFGENIIKVKGALSPGINHSPFSTRRYYDLLTHLPLQKQVATMGITYPVVRFYPADKVLRMRSRHELLNYMINAQETELAEYLFIEEGAAAVSNPVEPDIFERSENLSWLNSVNLFLMNREFRQQLAAHPDDVRADLHAFLSTPDYELEVKGYSPNEIAISVKNGKAGFLYYNDGWSRYWQAFDNDREIPVNIANYNFKAVFLERGGHMVRFVFNPVHYKIGLIFYYLGMVSAAAIVVFLLVRSGKGAARDAAEQT
ncbi:MAG: hypothetical protein HZA17_12560 [Nitrospirae bacterium]|nr:hypothetical protein [Nitrospirota bacterium]